MSVHLGAWPADVYYGDMDAEVLWTDDTVETDNNGELPTYDANANHCPPWNDPDGKFDQDTVPLDGDARAVELAVGRVDLANMFVGAGDPHQVELGLLRQYLRRDHDFRTGAFTARARGFVDDNFGNTTSEAASAWGNFSAFFGAGNIDVPTPGDFPSNADESRWFPTLSDPNKSYLWAYGSGGGDYGLCNNVAHTEYFGNTRSYAVFTMLFGSYFGDWDNPENFLRAPLANTDGYGLVSIWGGRPNPVLIHMGMGETVGYDMQLTQSSFAGLYSGLNRMIHTALMGDPTLRMHIVAPVTNLQVDGSSGDLAWTAPTDTAVAEYRVYYAASIDGVVGTLQGDQTTFTPSSGAGTYMVRAVTLQEGSGTYYNASQGVFCTVS